MPAAETKPEQATPAKAHKHRSPAYPGLGLKDAIDKASVLHDKENHHYAPLESLSAHWVIKQTNSALLVAISALKQFGLLEEQGAGDSRQFRVTELALDILSYEPDSPKRIEAIKAAALKPPLHLELWNKYSGKLPSDPSIRVYLVRERETVKFNKVHVDSFIAQFRATIAFANLSDNDTIDEGEDGGGEGRKVPGIGDYVQWASDGVDRFEVPKRVESVSDDGIWALLKGEKTGIPMDELTVVDPPPLTTRRKGSVGAGRSKDPFAGRTPGSGPSITFPLPNDNQIEIRLTKRVTKKDFERIKKLVDLSEDSLVEPDDDDQSDS